MKDLAGIGMTSQRTRDRLIVQLKKLGIKDERVLDVMRKVPRHLFMADALSSRACRLGMDKPFLNPILLLE